MRNRKWLMFSIARNVGTVLKSVPKGVSHFVITFTNSERKINRKVSPEALPCIIQATCKWSSYPVFQKLV